MIHSFINSGKKLYTFFIGFSKAFDYVVRNNLWYKLLQYGIGGNILKIIMSMYKCVKTKVFVNGQIYASFGYKLVVRQGECLSPFLFAMYVNGMEEALSGGNTGVTVDDVELFLLFYADNAVIFAKCAGELQNGIDIFKKRFSKQSLCRWFETPSRSLWWHCNGPLLWYRLSEIGLWGRNYSSMLNFSGGWN